ncbi:pyridoxal phosphate-dependent aminotransferase [Lachnoanaerobaculum saburreum]|uniref:Aminotransferase, class I/II n=1 Tax=Lachnoanaerobaculum saburreum DSM 3986 TaxID=887325 RepID=E6LNN2_9FIRM|nr:pyridoxal phosphate-dependent aminotransferase [Lachnoanaerobaculum saburreum]EFU76549.1 aminotransferase, class I/II [Lachnoanaerobaculum saburreum DSM 3986]
MISKKMLDLGTKRSVIRDIFEYGNKLAKEIGAENVIDFSLGNPSTPAPREVANTIKYMVEGLSPKDYNSYTSSAGDTDTRLAVAKNLNKRFFTDYTDKNIFMTCGASASLNIIFKAIIEPNDEIIVNIPYFPEYKVFIEGQGGKPVFAKCSENLCLDISEIENKINENTKAILINSPNNPSGVIYPKENLSALTELLERKQNEYSHPIFLISDEPYRELVFTDEKPEFLPNLYNNTLVAYSWSKSLSLPGERIGYILVPNKVKNHEDVFAAVGGAARVLGYVCAPSMFQYVVKSCVDVEPNIGVYRTNRNILFKELLKMRYTVANPDGAFYMFIKSPNNDGVDFCERAKKYNMLLVPGEGFGMKEYVRLSFCVETEKIEKSIDIFKKLISEYDGEK